jgi:heme exporter protein B
LRRSTPFLHAVLAIAGKDLRAELRSRQLISAIALFALIATMVFFYTLEGQRSVQVAALPAVLWVIIVFAGTLGLNRSLAQEHDRGSLDALLLAPIDRSALFYGKLIGTWIFSLAVAAIVSLVLSTLFNTGLPLPAWSLIVVLGTIGFSAVGTFVGSMAIYARGRETTFPILILPVVLPIIMASVHACNAILADLPFSDWSVWIILLASVDFIFLILPYVLFEFIVEE